MQSTEVTVQNDARSAGVLNAWLQLNRTQQTSSALIVVLVLALAIVAGGRLFQNAESDVTSRSIAGLESIAWPSNSNRKPAPTPPTGGTTAVASVDSMIVGLEQRLSREPGDAKGWALLAQSYAFLGNVAQSEAASSKAVALGFDEKNLRQRTDLASQQPTDSDGRSLSADAVVIHGMVKLATAAPLELAPGSRLFVTAKAVDGASVPVAVLGRGVTEFPYQFELSDKDAMMPGVTLSDFDEIALSARLSQSGTAARSDGDLESPIKIVRLSEPGWVDLVIENR